MTGRVTASGTVWYRIVVGALCGGLVAMLAACGADPDEGTNGMGELAPEAIERRAHQVAEKATAVRLTGRVTARAQTYRFDVRLNEDGCVGEVSTDGSTFELLRVGRDLYLRAGVAFWRSQADRGGVDPKVLEELKTHPAEKLDGKYVKVAPDDPAYAELSGFTDKASLLDGLLAMEGEREVGEYGQLGGVRTIQVVADDGAGGAMDVALTGPPYPLRLQRGGLAGEVTLGDWNEEFALRAPKDDQVVDYGDGIIRSGD